jgi:hypothetical protein
VVRVFPGISSRAIFDSSLRDENGGADVVHPVLAAKDAARMGTHRGGLTGRKKLGGGHAPGKGRVMGLVSEGVDLLRLANKMQNVDLYKQLAEWIDKVTELQKENETLREERDKLSGQLRFKGDLERINGHVFVGGDGDEICPRCAESELSAAPCPSSFRLIFAYLPL